MQISTLDDASATRLPYPYNLNRVGNIARMRNSRLKWTRAHIGILNLLTPGQIGRRHNRR